MRKSRFAGLNEGAPVAQLRLGELLLYDFRRPETGEDARITEERAHALAVSAPFLAGSHAVWGLLLAGALLAGGAAPFAALPLGAAVAADLLLWRRLLSPGLTADRKARACIVHCGVTAILFGVSVLLLHLHGGSEAALARAALVAAVGAGVAAFFSVPVLLALCCLVTCAAVVAVAKEPGFIAIAVAGSLFLSILSVTRARDLLFAAHRRLAAEWEARKARRFIDEFEESGRGWFWETNADGVLTYLSEGLGRQLGLAGEAAIGRKFEDLLQVRESDEGDDARRTLAFHLAARFAFADVIVRGHESGEVWWSVSGSPNFDEYGRFLGFRGIGANLSEQRRSEAERAKLARYDSLTGLPNRAMMRATLDEALANAAERRQGCALMMIDLDRFKQVNDTYGHPMGDKLLKQVAQRLKRVIGREGQVGRLGGDEFEAILPGVAGEARLAEIATGLIAEVSRPYEIDGQRLDIGCSVGIAVGHPGKAYAAGLIKDADLALYAAKAAGRGTFRFFAPELHEQAAERQMLETDLRDALAKDQLRLLYQPVVDSVSEEVVAFEALLRWQHPIRGVLQPAAFIPIAEECGLMPRIGAWILRTACDEAAGWPAHVRVAVNLSPTQFADPGLPSIVTSALAASGVAPDRLELEITEGVFPADGEGPERMLRRLKTIGVRLALDNFGTGRSGLGHLRDAPLDKIKIDRSFVCGAGDKGSRNAAIIRAIVVLAESLGIDTTAEGTETLEELALIRSLGCSQVQGFLFAKPMAAAEAQAMAAASKPTGELVGFSRPPRHRLIRNGVIECEGETLPVRLRNISTGGAMVECERSLAPGTAVLLDLDEAGRLEAEVRWSRGGQIGLRFALQFAMRRLARVKAGPSGLKMLTPSYLDPRPPYSESTEPAPLTRLGGSGKAGR